MVIRPIYLICIRLDVYSELMSWNTETDAVFKSEKTKSDIFLKEKENISKQIERAKKFPRGEREKIAFGAVFECLAISERLDKRTETDQQKGLRLLIQDLFQNSDTTFGEKWLSKPDFVSVIFSKNGEIVIDEILEAKSSIAALEHGVKKEQSQPQNSINTIEKVVDLINSMIHSKDISELSIINDLPSSYRKEFLARAFNRIKELDIKKDITFSSNLKYHIVLANGEMGASPDFSVTIKGKPVQVEITRSRFGKKDIHHIIDHYAETP